DMTMLYFTASPEKIYYTNSGSYADVFQGVQDFKNEVQPEIQKISSEIGTSTSFNEIGGKIYMVRNIVNPSYIPYAVIVMELNAENVFDSFSGVVWGTDTTIWLNDAEINLKGEPLSKKSLEKAIDGYGANFIIDQKHSNIFAKYNFYDYQISYAIKIDSSPLTADLATFNRLLFIIAVLLIPLLLIVVSFFYQNVTKPINSFLKAYVHLENGELAVQIKKDFSNREFQYLASAFNTMSAKLKYQFDRIYMEELALRDAKIMALQSQINPHFLNNTLEIINWEARIEGNLKVSRMIESLSTLLDAAMDRKGLPTVRVYEELMYVDAYLYIISERFGKRLSVKKEIQQECLDCHVPRLIMQPIIENAIEHGVESNQKGNIVIRIYKDDRNLYIEVENDGAMSQEDEKRIQLLLSDDYDAKKENSNNLGIRNVHQRIKIIYGGEAGLSIKINSFGRAVAKIIIPNDQSKQ
ncbi:MAG: histidine kinase, partial [Oscillospiraceae bacterium]